MRRNPRIWPTSGVGQGRGGRRPWEAWEDDLVLAHYRDLPSLKALLPQRTHCALARRAARLGATAEPRKPWTGVEQTKLRRLRAQGLTVRELEPHFPGRTYRSIEDQLRESRIFLFRRPAHAQVPLLHEVRQRAFELGISLQELARRTRTTTYFLQPDNSLILRHIAAGARVLGGSIEIEWEPLD